MIFGLFPNIENAEPITKSRQEKPHKFGPKRVVGTIKPQKFIGESCSKMVKRDKARTILLYRMTKLILKHPISLVFLLMLNPQDLS